MIVLQHLIQRLTRLATVLKWVLRRQQRHKVVGSLLMAAAAYSLWRAMMRILKAQNVTLFFNQNERNRRLIGKCKNLHTYKPTAWLFNGHMQTLFAVLGRRMPSGIKYARTFVDLRDGGHVALDWLEPFKPAQPTVLVLHGLTGGSQEPYVQWLLRAVADRGYQGVVMNARGCGGTGLSTARGFSAAQTADVAAAVKEIRRVIQDAPLFAVGYSLGAGILVKYLGERGTRCGISAAAAMCGSYDMMKTMHRMESWSHRHTYNAKLASNLKKWLSGHEQVMRRLSWLDLQEAYSAKTVRDFDSACIVDMFGYKDVWDYYKDASAGRFLSQIAVPLLVANAADDPISHVDGIPLDAVEKNDKLFLALTEEGGHVAWCQSLWPRGDSWDNQVVPEFFDAIRTDLEFLQEEQNIAAANENEPWQQPDEGPLSF